METTMNLTEHDITRTIPMALLHEVENLHRAYHRERNDFNSRALAQRAAESYIGAYSRLTGTSMKPIGGVSWVLGRCDEGCVCTPR